MEIHRLISMILLGIGLSHQALAMIAYDCEDETSELSTISLRDVAECPKPELSYTSEKRVVIVLQRNELKMVRVKTCLVEITRIISHCGMHSHSSMVAGGVSSYVHRVGSEECKDIHRYGTFKIFHQTIGDIKPNSSTSASLTLLGQIDNFGKCQGAIYHEKGQTWNDVVISAAIRVQVTDYLAVVKMEENEISLNGKIACPFIPGYCFDAVTGETIWDTTSTNKCEHQFSKIFEGEAEIVKNIQTAEEYIVVQQKGKIFALTLSKSTTICNLEAWQTEHPRIIILKRLQTLANNLIIPQNIDLTAYINSKFLYIEQAYKQALEDVYIDTIHRRCLLHREVLRNRLLMAPLLPNMVSQIVKDQEGYVGRVLGETLYILKCVPKIVKLRRTDRCYNELPIELNNQSRFLSPITRIIQRVAEEIDCNSMTPPLYFINDEWIGMAPLLTVKQPPQELSVATAPTLNFTPILPLGEQGLYTLEEASSVQKILTFGTERKAIENIIARRVSGTTDTQNQGMSTLRLFNPEELRDLAQSSLQQMWGWFSDVGISMSGIVGFYFIFRLIKYTLSVLINGVQLYKTVGLSFQLIACIWNTVTMWVIHRRHTRISKNQEADRDPEASAPLEKVTDHPSSTSTYRNPTLQAAVSTPSVYPLVNFSYEREKTLKPISVTSLISPSAPHWTDTIEA